MPFANFFEFPTCFPRPLKVLAISYPLSLLALLQCFDMLDQLNHEQPQIATAKELKVQPTS